MDIVFDNCPNTIKSVVYCSKKKNKLQKIEPGRFHFFGNIIIFYDTFADEVIGNEMQN